MGKGKPTDYNRKSDWIDVGKITNYLLRHKENLSNLWEEVNMALNTQSLEELNLLTDNEKVKLNAPSRLEKEVYLREILEKKLNRLSSERKINYTENNYNKDDYSTTKLCLWIIKNWGGISSSNDKKTIDIVNDFINEKSKYKFERISSTSKVASFLDSKNNIIYDSRVIYTMNWIIFSEEAGDLFFPMPEGRNARMSAFDINVLINLKNIDKFQQQNEKNRNIKNFIGNTVAEFIIKKSEAYKQMIKLVKEIHANLWEGDEEKKDKLFYTEMLLYLLADKNVFDEIVEWAKGIKLK